MFTFDFCLVLCTCAQHGTGGRQRTTLPETVHLPSAMWISEMELRSSGLAATPWPAQPSLWPQGSADYLSLSSLSKVQKWVARFCNVP